MRAGCLVLLALLAGCAVSFEAGGGDDGDRATATVTKVTDGDTLRLSGLGSTRLIGIDTPETWGPDECFGREATAFAERVVPPGTEVRYRLGVEERDRYGRVLAYVYLRDGRLFNELLTERGYAQPLTIPPNDEFADRFVVASRTARSRGAGLWGPGGCV
jgi:micrococcal nuclease